MTEEQHEKSKTNKEKQRLVDSLLYNLDDLLDAKDYLDISIRFDIPASTLIRYEDFNFKIKELSTNSEISLYPKKLMKIVQSQIKSALPTIIEKLKQEKELLQKEFEEI